MSSAASAGQPGAGTLSVDRIGRTLLFTTAFVETIDSKGRGGAGTSFFYDGMAGDGSTKRTLPMLVTNRHVVEHAVSGQTRFLRADAIGSPLLGSPVFGRFTPADWFLHPDPSVDVAVAPVGNLLSGLAAQGDTVFYRMVSREILPRDEVAAQLDVLEPITFVGYPSALYDSVNLTPIIRRGTLATPVQLDYCGEPQFLVDASVFPGSSGSPVFLLNDNGYVQDGTHHLGAVRLLFLGVIAEVHIRARDGRIVVGAGPNIQVDEVIDLGVVFNWRAVEETVDLACKHFKISRDSSTYGPPLT